MARGCVRGQAGVAQRGCAGPFVGGGQGGAEIVLGVDEGRGGGVEVAEPVALGGAAAGAQEAGPGVIGRAA